MLFTCLYAKIKIKYFKLFFIRISEIFHWLLVGDDDVATLNELSERTGYSTATISRILNDDPTFTVTPEVRRIVLEEAGRLNYNTTRSRRGRTPKSRFRIGIAEMLTPVQQLGDPYYLYLSNFVRQGCMDKKYMHVSLASQGDRYVTPEGGKIDGIIAIGLFSTPQIENLSSICSNVVFLDSSPFESRFSSVVLGCELGISLAVDHLVQLGHMKIGYIGPSLKKYCELGKHAPDSRREIFSNVMKRHGLLNEDYLLEAPMETEATTAAVQEYIKSGKNLPTAFLCANEESAFGTIRGLRLEGYRVPEDVSVVSFNDTPRAALVDPPLTSVSIHLEEMANAALWLLGEQVVSPGKKPIFTVPMKIVVPPTLVVRKSSKSVSDNETD